jgi:putative membrane protein
LSVYNDYLGRCLAALKNSTNTKSAKFFRIINEIPTLILIIVVFLAIFKPI